jgi:hypothetical protein
MVRDSRLLFRHGIKEMLELEIPITIVSGGIGEIIEAHFSYLF